MVRKKRKGKSGERKGRRRFDRHFFSLLLALDSCIGALYLSRRRAYWCVCCWEILRYGYRVVPIRPTTHWGRARRSIAHTPAARVVEFCWSTAPQCRCAVVEVTCDRTFVPQIGRRRGGMRIKERRRSACRWSTGRRRIERAPMYD